MEEIYFSFDNIKISGWVFFAVAFVAAAWLLFLYRRRVLLLSKSAREAEARDERMPQELPAVSVLM